MYARLNKDQTQYLRGVVKGKVVADLGCGDGTLTRLMARWGAKFVHGIDKELPPARNSKKVRWHTAYFNEWEMPPEVELAVVSWPRNAAVVGLVELCSRVPEVLYVGKNTDGIACGNPQFIRTLSERVDIRYIPDQHNVLIHYGSGRRPFPYIYHEEYAGKDDGGTCFPYSPVTERFREDEWRTKLHRA